MTRPSAVAAWRSALPRSLNSVLLVTAMAMSTGCKFDDWRLSSTTSSASSAPSGGSSSSGSGSSSGSSSSGGSTSSALCGDALASRDLAGQCRQSPPTMGALEAESGSAAVAALVSTALQSASRQVVVSWQPYAGNVSGYLVYYGPTPDSTSIYASDLSLASGGINPSAPSVTYDPLQDLGLNSGQSVCFRVYAYDTARALSERSDLVCTVV